MIVQQISLKQNTVVGNWRIGSLLGRGGQGAVWVARPTATRNSPPRALKASFATDAKGRARFEREAKMLRNCTSPPIVAIHDVDLTWTAHCDGIPEFSYYITDHCEGSLESMKEHLGDEGARITLFVEACKSVEYLHGLADSVIHRDIKPANFLIASEPRRVVLADLGIARYEAVESELTAERMLRWRSKYDKEVFSERQMGPVVDDILANVSARIVFSLGSIYSIREWPPSSTSDA